ncbi:hypothetical protein EVAR_93068_1 [Eumeta japonica]|uniref:Uncharacterized protein n=1 Tax=Eumeta variegata TaxID=151549 RepID=A0A4C1TI81_EUMVA|nr:hypothetical protein EVAR_93068_1 [Eumeta japonica]
MHLKASSTSDHVWDRVGAYGLYAREAVHMSICKHVQNTIEALYTQAYPERIFTKPLFLYSLLVSHQQLPVEIRIESFARQQQFIMNTISYHTHSINLLQVNPSFCYSLWSVLTFPPRSFSHVLVVDLLVLVNRKMEKLAKSMSDRAYYRDPKPLLQRDALQMIKINCLVWRRRRARSDWRACFMFSAIAAARLCAVVIRYTLM